VIGSLNNDTGEDKHLKELKTYPGIPIVTARELLELPEHRN
jgi:hypothetical protein